MLHVLRPEARSFNDRSFPVHCDRFEMMSVFIGGRSDVFEIS